MAAARWNGRRGDSSTRCQVTANFSDESLITDHRGLAMGSGEAVAIGRGHGVARDAETSTRNACANPECCSRLAVSRRPGVIAQ
jgi:hypothetical protein